MSIGGKTRGTQTFFNPIELQMGLYSKLTKEESSYHESSNCVRNDQCRDR